MIAFSNDQLKTPEGREQLLLTTIANCNGMHLLLWACVVILAAELQPVPFHTLATAHKFLHLALGADGRPNDPDAWNGILNGIGLHTSAPAGPPPSKN